MSDQSHKLQAALARFETELAGLGSLDDDSRQVLATLQGEIQGAIKQPPSSPAAHESLIDRLHLAVEQFEVSHPNIVGVVRGLIDSLSQLGI